MSTPLQYVRLSEAPALTIRYPECDACRIETDHDGDGFVCPSCGTSWDSNAGDGDQGTLYAEWSGEEPAGPVATNNEAHLWGYYVGKMHAHRLLPDLIPEPTPPRFKTAEGDA